MKIHRERLPGVDYYIKTQQPLGIEARESDFESIFRPIRRFMQVTPETRILEIGTGAGWLPTLCKTKGLCCEGIEISPQLVEYGRKTGREQGAEPDIRVDNVETAAIGPSIYDLIIATSTFEHVEDWPAGIRNVFQALRPGGLFYFYSTNKFSLTSGEYNFPLYGWLPDRWRYRLRIARQGEDIMKLGIDFNQFTYPRLRRFFVRTGFSRVLDQVDILDPDRLNNPRLWKKAVLKVLKSSTLLKSLALIPLKGTQFICIK